MLDDWTLVTSRVAPVGEGPANEDGNLRLVVDFAGGRLRGRSASLLGVARVVLGWMRSDFAEATGNQERRGRRWRQRQAPAQTCDCPGQNGPPDF